MKTKERKLNWSLQKRGYGLAPLHNIIPSRPRGRRGVPVRLQPGLLRGRRGHRAQGPPLPGASCPAPAVTPERTGPASASALQQRPRGTGEEGPGHGLPPWPRSTARPREGWGAGSMRPPQACCWTGGFWVAGTFCPTRAGPGDHNRQLAGRQGACPSRRPAARPAGVTGRGGQGPRVTQEADRSPAP